jgi:hypothetical protein
LRSQQHELVDGLVVIGGVTRHQRRAPRPADQIDLVETIARADERNRRRNVPHRHLRANDGLVIGGRRSHLGRPGRIAVASDIYQVGVMTACGQVIHPRRAAKRKIERCRSRIGRSGNEQQGLFRGELLEICAAFMANEQLDPGGIARDHDFLGNDFDFGGLNHCGIPYRI